MSYYPSLGSSKDGFFSANMTPTAATGSMTSDPVFVAYSSGFSIQCVVSSSGAGSVFSGSVHLEACQDYVIPTVGTQPKFMSGSLVNWIDAGSLTNFSGSSIRINRSPNTDLWIRANISKASIPGSTGSITLTMTSHG